MEFLLIFIFTKSQVNKNKNKNFASKNSKRKQDSFIYSIYCELNDTIK